MICRTSGPFHRWSNAGGPRPWTLLLGFVLTLPSLGSRVVIGATYHVPNEFATIQAGINACAPGDTVLVSPGVYEGDGNRDLDFHGMDLVVRSMGGAEVTVIECGGSEQDLHRGFYFGGGESRRSVVEGFTIRGGAESGGGLRFDGTSSPTIRACILRENTAALPGYSWGSAVDCTGSSAPRIESCIVTENGDPLGTGTTLSCRENSRPEFIDCHIYHNVAATGAGVQCHDSSAPIVSNCRIEGNTALAGGGIYSTSMGLMRIEGCSILRNLGTAGGGGIYGGRFDIIGTTVANNRVSDGSGGGMRLSDAYGQATIARSLLYGNCAPTGPDLALGVPLDVTCCALDTARIQVWPSGELVYHGQQVFSSPQLCDPWPCPGYPPPPLGGDYRLRSDSPCLPHFSPCGELIGALGLGCPAPSPVGACCLDDQTCALLTQDQCLNQSGSYRGDDVGCFPDPCVGNVIEPASWGKIKARFRR